MPRIKDFRHSHSSSVSMFSSMEEMERSTAVKSELANVMNKLLSLSLHIPNSPITSVEARNLLDGLYTVHSDMESIPWNHPLIDEINSLEEVEQYFVEKELEQTQVLQWLTETKEALWRADLETREAEEAELAARRALEKAQRQASAKRKNLMDCNRMYASAEEQHRKTVQELEKVSLSLERKQEKVRTALRQNKEELMAVRMACDRESSDKMGLSDLQRLRKEERQLRAESNRLDERAKGLQSISKKLKRRSEELKAEEESMFGGNG